MVSEIFADDFAPRQCSNLETTLLTVARDFFSLVFNYETSNKMKTLWKWVANGPQIQIQNCLYCTRSFHSHIFCFTWLRAENAIGSTEFAYAIDAQVKLPVTVKAGWLCKTADGLVLIFCQ